MALMPIYHLKGVPKMDLDRLKGRSELEINRIADQVKVVVEDVRNRGDRAVVEYVKKFDRVDLKPQNLLVSLKEFDRASKTLAKPIKRCIEHAAENIQRFHQAQMPVSSWFTEVDKGILIGQITTPLSSVGLYVPGGRGSFPSTVLMSVIPAKIAGVEKLAICTPPRPDGRVDAAALYAADMLGVHEVFKVGGAQAIAAMAFGTETIPKVDKIVGPGGIWVSAAKRMILNYGNTGIDFIAGPSENLVLADDSANPRYVAADVLIEPEHGSDSAGVVVTTSRALAEKVQSEVEKFIGELPEKPINRRRFATDSIAKYGAIIVTENLDEAIDFVNSYSVEHLEIMTRAPLQTLMQIKNAGSIYLGDYSPCSVGCYACGANHILPTGTGARIFSGLSVRDFIKQIDYSYLSKQGLETINDTIRGLSEYEGFPQHGKAVRVRFE